MRTGGIHLLTGNGGAGSLPAPPQSVEKPGLHFMRRPGFWQKTDERVEKGRRESSPSRAIWPVFRLIVGTPGRLYSRSIHHKHTSTIRGRPSWSEAACALPLQISRCPDQLRSGLPYAAFPSSAGSTSFGRYCPFASLPEPEARHRCKRFLSMGLPVCVYLFHQFFGVMPGGRRALDLYLLFRVGIGFDVRAVYKDCLGPKVFRLRHFLQDPAEYPVYRLLCKPVPEIITHRGKIMKKPSFRWTFLTDRGPP